MEFGYEDSMWGCCRVGLWGPGSHRDVVDTNRWSRHRHSTIDIETLLGRGLEAWSDPFGLSGLAGGLTSPGAANRGRRFTGTTGIGNIFASCWPIEIGPSLVRFEGDVSQRPL